MTYVADATGANVDVQIFDTRVVPLLAKHFEALPEDQAPVLFVLDYAFGEQAFEIMDELLKPIDRPQGGKEYLDVRSVSIMGKAGILEGGKGDIMVPTAYIFEGTADNYPLDNALCADDFQGCGLRVFEGPLITVLGTSLQNKDVLEFSTVPPGVPSGWKWKERTTRKPSRPIRASGAISRGTCS